MACNSGSIAEGFCSAAKAKQEDMHVRVSREVARSRRIFNSILIGAGSELSPILGYAASARW